MARRWRVSGKYALGTTVDSAKSRAEIEMTLRRYGADGFLYGYEGSRALLRFRAHDRYVSFTLDIPQATEKRFERNGNGYVDTAGRKRAAAAEERRLWRCLLLAIKSKLEVVESGIATFEEEFLAHITLPDGTKVGDWMKPQLHEVYASGAMPTLLPSVRELDAG